ncbi:MAG TPA: VTT domain-containing protein [Polyangia bacterium]|jgi:membrane protein DedA with SNARE-associated domain
MLASPYLDSFIQYIAANNNPVGLTILGLSAAIEYIFPPFPGDTITLFGAFLITAKGWSFALVFGVVLLGSAAGAMADFYFGRWLAKKESHWTGKRAHARTIIDGLVARFERHGEMYVALNRFLPAVRAFFFVAAGMAGLRPGRVLFWSLVSATGWNLLIIAAGAALGANWQRIQWFAAQYSRVVGIAICVVAAGFAVRWWIRRRRAARPR